MKKAINILISTSILIVALCLAWIIGEAVYENYNGNIALQVLCWSFGVGLVLTWVATVFKLNAKKNGL